jgi:hypothetical protein
MQKLAVTLVLLVLLVVGDGSALAQGSTPDGAAITVPFPTAITIDGDLTDWAAIPLQQVQPSDAPYAAFSVGVTADDRQLYVMMQAADGPAPDDSLLFYLNYTDDLTTNTYDKGIVEVAIRAADIDSGDSHALTVNGINSAFIPANVAIIATSTGWGFELAMPFDSVFVPSDCGACEFPPPRDLSPYDGKVIGFQARRENGTAPQNSVWANADRGSAAWEVPANFGHGIFVDATRQDTSDNTIADWFDQLRSNWERFKSWLHALH